MGYAPGLARSCRQCSEDITWSAVGLAIVLGLAALSMVVLIFSHLGSMVPDAARGGIEEGRHNLSKGKCGSFSDFLVTTLPLRSIKIVATVWQIISQFGSIAGDVYPEVYNKFVTKLSPINLDMDFVLSYSCMFGNDFYDHLLVATAAPIFFLVMVAGSYVIAKKRNNLSGLGRRTTLHKHQATALYLALFVYSPVSYKVFQTFSCDELDDGNSYLTADYSIMCNDPRHKWYETFSVVMVAVYPVGIAAVLAWLSIRHRHELVMPDRDTREHLKPYQYMWAAYKPSRYYFEVVECARRTMLTGIAALVLPNSREQLSIVLLFSVVFVFVSEAVSPFQNSADMNLYRWGNGIIVASMYVAFLMKVDVGHDESPALLTYSGVLIAANVFMIVTVLLQTAFLAKEWCAASKAARSFGVPVRRAV